jgi:hypothetical protein
MAPHIAETPLFCPNGTTRPLKKHLFCANGTTRPLKKHLFCANDTTRLLARPIHGAAQHLIELYSTRQYCSGAGSRESPD